MQRCNRRRRETQPKQTADRLAHRGEEGIRPIICHCLLDSVPAVLFDVTNRHRFVNPSCKQCIRDRQNDGPDKNADDSKGDQSANHAGKDQQQGMSAPVLMRMGRKILSTGDTRTVHTSNTMAEVELPVQ